MTVRLTVAPAAVEDAGRGMARIDPAIAGHTRRSTGALLAITGGRTAYVRALPQRPTLRAEAVLHIDLATRGKCQGDDRRHGYRGAGRSRRGSAWKCGWQGRWASAHRCCGGSSPACRYAPATISACR